MVKTSKQEKTGKRTPAVENLNDIPSKQLKTSSEEGVKQEKPDNGSPVQKSQITSKNGKRTKNITPEEQEIFYSSNKKGRKVQKKQEEVKQVVVEGTFLINFSLFDRESNIFGQKRLRYPLQKSQNLTLKKANKI